MVGFRALGRACPYPGFGFDAELQQDGEEGERGDGRAPAEQIHIRVSVGLGQRQETNSKRQQRNLLLFIKENP